MPSPFSSAAVAWVTPDPGITAIGPAAGRGRVLESAAAPELVLPDIRTGEPFALSSLRGSKVVLVAWAPW